jgi:hypothetical protein
VGESFTESPGQALQAFKQQGTDLIVVPSFLLPDGAERTTNL